MNKMKWGAVSGHKGAFLALALPETGFDETEEAEIPLGVVLRTPRNTITDVEIVDGVITR